MIDPDLIESLDPLIRFEVRHALGVLAASNILTDQKRRLLDRVADGADTEDVQGVAASILEYRKQGQWLETLHQLGQEYIKEIVL